MQKLTGQLAKKAGGGRAVPEKTVGMMLGFLRNEGRSVPAQGLIETIQDAEPAVAGIQNIGGELFRFAHDTIGTDQMGAILSVTRGLSQLA